MRILVTGGTGSIGHEVVRQALLKEYHPIILSRDESLQAEMKREYPDCDYILGDVENLADLRYALSLEPDYVVHCAAMKHVPICEEQPVKAVQTNVLGTLNVLLTFAEMTNGVIIISTDKAVEPFCAMGYTKKLCELMAQDAMFAKNRVMVVRFGNIIPSRGSVIPLWLDAKRRGLPLRITDPEMTRFFVPVQDAVATVWAALDKGQSGDIWMPVLHKIRMGDLLNVIKGQSNVEVIGARPGEKKHELLRTPQEQDNAALVTVRDKSFWLIRPGFVGYKLALGDGCISEAKIVELLDKAMGDEWH